MAGFRITITACLLYAICILRASSAAEAPLIPSAWRSTRANNIAGGIFIFGRLCFYDVCYQQHQTVEAVVMKLSV